VGPLGALCRARQCYALLLTAGGPVVSFPGSARVDIKLLNSNRATRIEPLDQLPAHTDYFMGSREHWHTDVPNYSRVRYHAVYPGIDVVYYGNPTRLEYDFVLAPGADPRAIRLKFRGAGPLTITPEGDLAFQSAGTRMVQENRPSISRTGRPRTRRQVQGRYVLMARNVVGIRLDHYDRSQPLVIDPVLIYSTFMGGSGADQITAARLDSAGHLYVAGSSATNDLVATTNTYQPPTPAASISSLPSSIPLPAKVTRSSISATSRDGHGHSAGHGPRFVKQHLPYRNHHFG